MKASTKGALLSFLVYPGAGQLALGLKISGVLFAVLLVIIYRVTVRMYYALDPILSAAANKVLQWNLFINIIRRGHYDSWQVEVLCLGFLLVCWMTAGVHAYFAGRRVDR